MKRKSFPRAIGLLALGLLCGFGSVSAILDGKTVSGRFGGFRFIQKEGSPFLFWVYALGGVIVSAAIIFVGVRELRLLLSARRQDADPDRQRTTRGI